MIQTWRCEQDVVCKGMVAKGWNPGAGGGVVVVPVIGQYLELWYFCTARWLERPCHCPGNLECLCFRWLSSLQFFTASSARPLDWGYATEDRLCFTPHIWRNSWNAVEVNGWPPSVLISSGVPYVWNCCRQMDINFDVVAWPGFKWYNMSQPVRC